MDQKYIENLGMSSHIDEGLWDRLKSKAAGFTQAARNIAGGTVNVQAAKFDSIFKSFLKQAAKTILDFNKVIKPYKEGGKLTLAQSMQADKMSGLYRDVLYLSAIPITEANIFTRPFSAIGAQASGNPDNIIKTYRGLLEQHYNNFINDAKKLNVVPEEYLNRNIASRWPEAKNFFTKLGDVLGKDLTSKSQPTSATSTPDAAPSEPSVSSAPASTPPEATAPEEPVVAPASTPTPPPSSPPPEKTASWYASKGFVTPPAASPPTVTPPKPTGDSEKIPIITPDTKYPYGKPGDTASASSPASVPASTPSTPSAATSLPSSKMTPQEKLDTVFTLIKKSLENIVKNLKSTDAETDERERRIASSPTLDDIQSYKVRDEWKAQVPFRNNPPISVNTPDGNYVWKLRYHPDKNMRGHKIQLSMESYEPTTGKQTQHTPWVDFINFRASDVIDDKFHPNLSFNVLEKIGSAIPSFGKAIKLKQDTTGIGSEMKTLNDEVVKGLVNIVHVTQSTSADRGKRKLDVPVSAGRETSGGKTTSPIKKPMSPATTSVTPSPEMQGRTSKVGSPPITTPADLLKGKKPVIFDPEKTDQETGKPIEKKPSSSGSKKPTAAPAAKKPASKTTKKTVEPVKKDSPKPTPAPVVSKHKSSPETESGTMTPEQKAAFVAKMKKLGVIKENNWDFKDFFK